MIQAKAEARARSNSKLPNSFRWFFLLNPENLSKAIFLDIDFIFVVAFVIASWFCLMAQRWGTQSC